MQTIQLRRGQDGRARQGHPWVFSNEIEGDVGALEPGGAVELRAADGAFLGVGYANPRSLIAVRLVSRERGADLDDPELWAAGLRRAVALRERVLPGRRSLRVVAGEADDLPGLVIDCYDDVLAVQVGTLGLERRLGVLERAVRQVLAPAGAMLRNEAKTRLLEGLELEARLWFGEVPERVAFSAGGLRLVTDVRAGQKTGFFFDQADNRAFACACVAGLDVLDLFAHTGSWAVGALVAGARSAVAVAVEVSQEACALMVENAALNGVADRLTVVCADVRSALEGLAGRRFGAVFLDPPAFAKNRKTASRALVGYRNANQQALELVAPGGLLFTSSCSYHILEERFEAEVLRAAERAGRRLRQVRRGGGRPPTTRCTRRWPRRAISSTSSTMSTRSPPWPG